jgi:hypothetical protein
MSDKPANGRNPEPFLDRWTNDEVVLDMSDQPDSAPRPLPEKVRAQLLAERARWASLARKDPHFLAELKRHGIFLTAQELSEPEPPASS